jgi:hypothetical protein
MPNKKVSKFNGNGKDVFQLSMDFDSTKYMETSLLRQDVLEVGKGTVVSFERHKSLKIRELLIQDLIRTRVPVKP